MLGIIEKLLALTFYFILFFVPIVLWPSTSELFEFNKIVLVYLGTVIIVVLWLVKMVYAKKWIFRRTILDIPLIIFLFSQLLSTIFSIDPRTSMLGYYSRFNGGMASLVCYILLYWAWVSNIGRERALKSLKIIFASAIIVCLYAVLEHFGIDKNIWVQDVQARVFSTLGQPNWLATWIVALIPLTWAYLTKSREKGKRNLLFWAITFVLFPLTIFYTKSRSGFLGLGVAFAAFSFLAFFREKKTVKKLLLIFVSIAAIAILVGTPWSPEKPVTENVPAYEMGGTESGDIRKIVWKGALEIWKHHPIVGTGVETFAYSYYKQRPPAHNLVSEWDFLYNKAHNEYLNYMANSGTLGITSYLTLVFFTIYFLYKNKGDFNLALLSGYLGILAANFFGFSVTPVNLLFFLYPGVAFSLSQRDKEEKSKIKPVGNQQKFLVIFLIVLGATVLYKISLYWYTDTLYAKAKNFYDAGQFVEARTILFKTVKFSPSESLYWDKYSQAGAEIALALLEANDNILAIEYAGSAISESQKAIALSPRNLNFRRNQTTLYLKLAVFDKKLIGEAKKSVLLSIDLAPTDAKLYYNLALIYARLGENDKAIATLEETIKMKPNYKDAHLAHALMIADEGRKNEAIAELKYILEKIDPKDELTQSQLDDLTK
jgi:putative inorganic carbon (HCO3(-)) transporter